MKSKQFISALIIVCLCTSFSFPLHSQVLISLLFGEKLNSDKMKFGLDGGLNLSNLTGTEGTRFLENFNLGLYFDIRLKENSNWYIHTGALLKSEMGARGIDVYSLDEPGLEVGRPQRDVGDGVTREVRPDVRRTERMRISGRHQHAGAQDGVFDAGAAVVDAGKNMAVNVNSAGHGWSFFCSRPR